MNKLYSLFLAIFLAFNTVAVCHTEEAQEKPSFEYVCNLIEHGDIQTLKELIQSEDDANIINEKNGFAI